MEEAKRVSQGCNMTIIHLEMARKKVEIHRNVVGKFTIGIFIETEKIHGIKCIQTKFHTMIITIFTDDIYGCLFHIRLEKISGIYV